MFRVLWILLVIAACEPKEVIPDRGDTDGGGVTCGEVEHGITVTFTGLVLDADGQGVKSATVEVEDRYPLPHEVIGTGATLDRDGHFQVDGQNINYWHGCWFDYADIWIVATVGDRTAEYNANQRTFSAVDGGTFQVDISDRPLTLPP